MMIALLSVIVILLLPGGAPFLMRLCSGVLILMSLAIGYVLWGTAALWVIGGLAGFVAGPSSMRWPLSLIGPESAS